MVATELAEALPAGYDVILHHHERDPETGEITAAGHIHAEWDDAKRLEVWRRQRPRTEGK